MIAPFGWTRWKLPEYGARARGAAAATIAALAVLAVGMTGRAILDVESGAPTVRPTVTVGSQIPTNDTWMGSLTDPSAWRSGRYLGDRRGRRSMRPEEAPEEPDYDEDRPPPARTGFNGGRYRTVCVRLCDGYFFPISFATTPGHFAKDAAACSARCSSPARLYVYPNPGGEPEQMIGLDGKPYGALKSAFLFRTSYDAACSCKPQPWSQEALARHRAYADAQKKSGAPTVARTIRPEQQQADAAVRGAGGAGAPGRPGGAMLLGADQPSPATPRKPDARKAPDSQVSQPVSRPYGRRNDWTSRALMGD